MTENTDGTRIDVKGQRSSTPCKPTAVTIGRQPFSVSAGLYQRLILHLDAEFKSEYSPLVERRRRAPRLLPAPGGSVDGVRGRRADTSLFREMLNVG